MKFNHDTATTILGGVIAAATAAQPVLNGVNGSMHQGDFLSLLMAVGMALFGWSTNKNNTAD